MAEKERWRDALAYQMINIFGPTFKARLMDKLPLYQEAAFCKGVQCYVSSVKELRRSQREFDDGMTDWLASFQAGEVFYDIGANVGMFSLTAAKIHNQQVKVYAFEPSFSTFASLIKNIAANGFGEVVFPFSFALGARGGIHSFNYTDLTPGASVHTLDSAVNQTGQTFAPAFSQKVIAYSLDELIEEHNFEAPTHVKIDVDGGEKEIVEGMKRLLAGSAVKSVMIEVTETQADDARVRELFDIFKSAGFVETKRIQHAGFKTYPFVYDILFTKDWKYPHE
ncbi:MAG: FkbM family methyltransferase [Anaerolineales bacterium]|nr:FkbM family methyltransferase [Anaerolineales bacterium]